MQDWDTEGMSEDFSLLSYDTSTSAWWRPIAMENHRAELVGADIGLQVVIVHKSTMTTKMHLSPNVSILASNSELFELFCVKQWKQ